MDLELEYQQMRYSHQVTADELATALVELGSARAAIERVRALCNDLLVEDVNGGMTNADTLWPTDVLEALDGHDVR